MMQRKPAQGSNSSMPWADRRRPDLPKTLPTGIAKPRLYSTARFKLCDKRSLPEIHRHVAFENPQSYLFPFELLKPSLFLLEGEYRFNTHFQIYMKETMDLSGLIRCFKVEMHGESERKSAVRCSRQQPKLLFSYNLAWYLKLR